MAERARDVEGAKLDHVMIMVHDLPAASADFARLGFGVRPGARLPVGLENATIPFGTGGPYLELVSVYQRGAPALRDNEEFLAQGEGAIYVGLEVPSATEVGERLRSLGLEVQGPDAGYVKPPDLEGPPVVLWRSVTIQHGASPRSDPLFFTEYDRAAQAELVARSPEYARRWGPGREISHRNGATGLAAVWFAVDDLEKAALQYKALGFPQLRDFSDDRLECQGVELALGRGSLRLMQSTAPDGPLSRLLARHASHREVPGVSLEVPSLRRALAAMPSDVAAALEPRSDPPARGVMIPPRLGHGLWVELVERPDGSG